MHGACGFWGVLAVGWFGHYDYLSFGWDGKNGDVAGKARYGIIYGGGMLFSAQLVALIIEVAWVGGLTALLFFALKKTGLLRVSREIEEVGMVSSKHGGSAYHN